MVCRKYIANSTWMKLHLISEIWFTESIAHIRWMGGHAISELYIYIRYYMKILQCNIGNWILAVADIAWRSYHISDFT